MQVAVALLFACIATPALAKHGDENPIFSGGEAVTTCSYASTVFLRGSQKSCSGTLIAPDTILYAAHCGTDFSQAFFGERPDSTSDFQVHWPISNCTVDSRWDGDDSRYDFAVCKLTAASAPIPAAPIARGCERPASLVGKSLTLVGFGATAYAPNLPPEKRFVAGIEIASETNGVLTTKPGPNHVCDGGSGGPLYLEMADGSLRVVAIASTLVGDCGSNDAYNVLSLVRESEIFLSNQASEAYRLCFDDAGAWSPSLACRRFDQAETANARWQEFCLTSATNVRSTSCGAAVGSDEVAPSIAISDPTNGETFTPDDTVSLTAQISDAMSAQLQSDIFLDGQFVETQAGAAVSWSFFPASSGVNTITVVARDDSANAFAASVSVTIAGDTTDEDSSADSSQSTSAQDSLSSQDSADASESNSGDSASDGDISSDTTYPDSDSGISNSQDDTLPNSDGDVSSSFDEGEEAGDQAFSSSGCKLFAAGELGRAWHLLALCGFGWLWAPRRRFRQRHNQR